MFGIPERLVENTKVDLLYFDFLTEDMIKDEKSGIQTFVKTIIIDEIPENFNEEKHVVEFLISNIKNNNLDELKININLNDLINDTSKTLTKRKIISKLLLTSSKIAINGKMGSANSVLINTDTIITNSEFGDSILKALFELKESEINVYFSEYIPVNTIYMMRNGSMDEPGFKILRHTDSNEKDYFKIDGFGWFPDLQCAKIDIIPLECKKEKIIDIKNIEDVFTNRTMPLSEYGLYIIYNIGTAGLSQAKAQEEVETIMHNYTDININEISKYFKFYKEIWLTNNESQESKVEIKLI